MKYKGDPWERQTGETEKAYTAFSIYRDMTDKRTVQAVCDEIGKSYQAVHRWVTKYEWKERVRLYDNWLEHEARKNTIKQKEKMIAQQLKIARALQAKALKAFSEADESKMTFKDIKELIKLGTELEQNIIDRSAEMYAEKDEEAAATFADTICEAYQKRKDSGEQ